MDNRTAGAVLDLFLRTMMFLAAFFGFINHDDNLFHAAVMFQILLLNLPAIMLTMNDLLKEAKNGKTKGI